MLSALSHLIFGSKSGRNEVKRSLQYREQSLIFDSNPNDLRLVDGEILIGLFYPVEDIKGNADELGVLKVTNARLIWICCDKRKVNLSIGWNTILLTFQQTTRTALGYQSSSLCVLAAHDSTKYEFVFKQMTEYCIPDTLPTDFTYFDFNVNKRSVDGNYLTNNFSPNTTDEWDDEDNSMPLTGLIESTLLYQSANTLLDIQKPLQVTHISDFGDESCNFYDCIFKTWQSYKKTENFRLFKSEANSTIELGLAGNKEVESNNEVNISSVSEIVNNVDESIQLTRKVSSLPFQTLPIEKMLQKYSNLLLVDKKKSLKNSGTLFATNVRLVWIPDANFNTLLSTNVAMASAFGIRQDTNRKKENTNSLSIPFLKIESIKSKRSMKLVIAIFYSSYRSSNSTIIEFKLDKKSSMNDNFRLSDSYQLENLTKSLNSLLEKSRENPIFGPEVCSECIEFIDKLIPIEEILEKMRTILDKNFDNFPMSPDSSRQLKRSSTGMRLNNAEDGIRNKASEYEERENDFARRANNYTNNYSAVESFKKIETSYSEGK